MMGNTGKTGWKDLAPFFIVITVSSLLLISKTRDLDIMNSGDETAKSLGIEVEKTRMFIMTVSSLITASVIGFTGMIGFVGLVAPHIMRLILGGDNRFLVPASALFGAAFLLGSDILAMKVIEPSVLPVGIITALLGGPLFFILIIKRKGAEQW
jgi:iron complex transport system permease protein